MVDITRGDIVLCDLNPVVGTEQAGIRPVVVVQIDKANFVSPHTIIAMRQFIPQICNAQIAYPRGKTEIHPLLWSGISAVTPADMNDRIDVLAEQIGIQAIWSVGGTWTRAA